MTEPHDLPSLSPSQPKWQPLSPRQRRVVGVLIEKAKTTPDAYPLSSNGIAQGCNQKSNRSPQMNLSTEDVAEVLDELRVLGAVAEVQGSGRVPKYRHLAYDWLGVDKVELAVMAELLLRGEQTVGELRARASRMEPMADLAALRPVLQSLIEKRLVVALTPEGRGQVVSHGLYKPREWDELKAKFSSRPSDAVAASDSTEVVEPRPSPPVPPRSPAATHAMVEALQNQVAQLSAKLDQLQARVDALEQLRS